MEKAKDPSLFVNDGSFMERFKQLEQEKGNTAIESKASNVNSNLSGSSTPKIVISKTNFIVKGNESRKPIPSGSGGKLAFSLKQKSKIVTPPVKLDEDEDEDEKDAANPSGGVAVKRPKLDEPIVSVQSSKQSVVVAAPPPPSDPTVKKVADKLASFVAKNGRQFENVTRQKNPGDTPFKFLFDESCPDYKYYEYRLGEEEKALSKYRDPQSPQSGGTRSSTSNSGGSSSRRSYQDKSNYQIPASALYETSDSSTRISAAPPTPGDPIAMMEYYMKKAADEEKSRAPKSSKDEMPPPPSLLGSTAPGKKGHHMGDYIPPEELAKFLATCNDVGAQKAAKELADRSKIQADNIGHKLLAKMGWKEGEGLGSSRSGIADPITAGEVKSNNLGVGAHNPGEVTPEDDIYEQYKKRMMLGYRHRPNPLNNPRKQYY
ncbi:unnamed protein product [Cuscuta europaea]|uniref:SURP and G-patch domain-containing protein 1-like protein n=1 Tax=Cuscuta europaea TaxID=41803 RepID=A0A9P0Z8T6_CUSEU|nr:unnamed protein product [Cuscuta europaea]